ncbi:MAG: PfkB family carbohydrate kinase [Planctomycetota bacterium]
MSLAVFGTVSVDRVDLPGGDSKENILGGSGAYFAAAASFYGPTSLVAAVGGDWPSEHEAMLSAFDRLDLSAVDRRQESTTFAWGGKYLDNMDHRETIYTHLGVLEEAAPPVPPAVAGAQHVFLANMHPAMQVDVLQSFNERSLAVADTMDLWIDVANDDLRAMIAAVDGLVLNHDEAEKFTGEKNPVTAGKKILELGPTFVVVKKGEHGCLFVERFGGEIGVGALPAFPAERVVDPTGAGDSFAGGVMGYLANTSSEAPLDADRLRTALAHGTVMASFTIETFSLERLSKLDTDQLATRYAEYASMLRIA